MKGMAVARAFAFGALITAVACSGCATKKFEYLGVPEKEGRIVDSFKNPGSRIRITPIRTSSTAEYESFKMAGKVENEETHEEHLYYTVREIIPVTSSSMSTDRGTYLTVFERYKVKMKH
jgi:hypothetical protein